MIPQRILYAQIDEETWKKFKSKLVIDGKSIKEFIEGKIYSKTEKEKEQENENIPKRKKV